MRIIICDKNSKDAESMSSILKKNNILSAGAIEVQTLDSCERLLFELSDEPDEADVIITEVGFGDKMNGIEAIKRLRSVGYSGEVIFLTNDRESVFDSFEVRPANYLIKDSLGVRKFAETIADALEHAKSAKETC